MVNRVIVQLQEVGDMLAASGGLGKVANHIDSRVWVIVRKAFYLPVLDPFLP